jgi:hypothetical protein
VDLRQVEGRLTTHEQQLVGELVASKLPLVNKLASIVHVGEVTHNSERAAVGAGVQLRVFDSKFAALAWLLERKPGQVPSGSCRPGCEMLRGQP